MPRESKQALQQRIHAQLALLEEQWPQPYCALYFHNPFELLIATVLSAQCTDKRVNQVTPTLFKAFPTAEAMSKARLEDIAEIIRPCGFYRAKAEHCLGIAMRLMDVYHGEVPSAMEDLVTLPGVGRKTANVVRGNAFHIPGFPVDTHVLRVSGRLRWRSNWKIPKPDAVLVESILTALIPEELWTDTSHRLIYLGREFCHARSTDCMQCPLVESCPSAFKPPY